MAVFGWLDNATSGTIRGFAWGQSLLGMAINRSGKPDLERERPQQEHGTRSGSIGTSKSTTDDQPEKLWT